jgi:hypothetical protein
MFKNKYLKYKEKYLDLKNNIVQKGGSSNWNCSICTLENHKDMSYCEGCDNLRDDMSQNDLAGQLRQQERGLLNPAPAPAQRQPQRQDQPQGGGLYPDERERGGGGGGGAQAPAPRERGGVQAPPPAPAQHQHPPQQPLIELLSSIISEKKDCDICLTPASQFVNCGNNHLACIECFSYGVTTQLNDKSEFAKNGGEIICLDCKAASKNNRPIIKRSILYQATPKLVGSLLEGKDEIVRRQEEAIREGTLKQMKIDHDISIAQLKMAAETDKQRRFDMEVEMHRKHIVNTLMSVECPHCKLVFNDWSDCFAVKCIAEYTKHGIKTIAGCGNYFCGWCLAPYQDSDSCHKHVFNCKESLNRGSVYGRTFDGNDFRIIERKLRKDRIEKYLSEKLRERVSRQVIDAVKDKIEVHLKTLGLLYKDIKINLPR